MRTTSKKQFRSFHHARGQQVRHIFEFSATHAGKNKHFELLCTIHLGDKHILNFRAPSTWATINILNFRAPSTWATIISLNFRAPSTWATSNILIYPLLSLKIVYFSTSSHKQHNSCILICNFSQNKKLQILLVQGYESLIIFAFAHF